VLTIALGVVVAAATSPWPRTARRATAAVPAGTDDNPAGYPSTSRSRRANASGWPA
jgi:hypothetical protein